MMPNPTTKPQRVSQACSRAAYIKYILNIIWAGYPLWCPATTPTSLYGSMARWRNMHKSVRIFTFAYIAPRFCHLFVQFVPPSAHNSGNYENQAEKATLIEAERWIPVYLLYASGCSEYN